MKLEVGDVVVYTNDIEDMYYYCIEQLREIGYSEDDYDDDELVEYLDEVGGNEELLGKVGTVIDNNHNIEGLVFVDFHKEFYASHTGSSRIHTPTGYWVVPTLLTLVPKVTIPLEDML